MYNEVGDLCGNLTRKNSNNPTYRDAEVMKRIAADEFIGVVIFVRRKKVTPKFTIRDVMRGSQVKREAEQALQTRESTAVAFVDKVLHKSRDVQVGVFFFLEVDEIQFTCRSTATDNSVNFDVETQKFC